MQVPITRCGRGRVSKKYKKEDSDMKYILPVILFVASLGVFYGFFFKLAPYMCTLIPPGQWQSMIKVVVYIVVAYSGGIGIPMVLAFYGLMLISNQKDR